MSMEPAPFASREDRPSPSPRTAAEPMAFTRDELLSGAVRAWGLFVGLFTLGLLLRLLTIGGSDLASGMWFVAIVSGYALMIAAGVSAFATAAMVPLVWVLGRALRSVHRLVVHLVVYMALGVLMAVAAYALAQVITDGMLDLATSTALAAAIAIPLGWWLTARAALREDHGGARRARAAQHPDEAFEDSAVQ
ncbi:hypothetical protein ACWGJP_11855 [Microbacterium sp. NPDC055903]